HGRLNRSPRVIRATFLLMPVGSTSQRSVQVSGFEDIGLLTPLCRLIRFLFVRPAFCLGLPSDSQSPATPLPLANTSPCRVCRGLAPPSHQRGHHSQAGCACAQRAMPGAPIKNPEAFAVRVFVCQLKSAVKPLHQRILRIGRAGQLFAQQRRALSLAGGLVGQFRDIADVAADLLGH
ncbi:hypothetical protein SAMN03159386_01386, partial [Pseudomonas sp. NFACC17-2]